MAEFSFDVEVPAVAPVSEAANTTSTNTLVHNPAHVAEAQSHLITFFRKPRWLELLRALADQSQEIEDAAFDVLEAFNLDTATGEALNILGRWVGEPRADRTDNDYRAAVRARVLVDSSDGKLEQLIAIVLALIPGALVAITELQPAAMTIEVVGAFGGVTLGTLAGMLRQARAAGVRLDVTAVDTAEALIWASDDVIDPLGWGADSPETRGEWSSVS